MAEDAGPEEDLKASAAEVMARFRTVKVTPELKAAAATDMERCFYAHEDRFTGKWAHYLEVYDRFLSRLRGRPARLLEIGILHGGSLQLWREYLGPQAVIHGLDINPRVAGIDDPDLTVHVGSQSDTTRLDAILRQMGGADVIIDDGGHRSRHQIASFEHLFPQLSDGGIYICEDIHSSYWRYYSGGLRRADTFIEYLKGLIDVMHAHYLEPADALEVPDFLRHVHAISVFDSVAVIEKRAPRDPFRVTAGERRLAEP